MSEEVQDQVPKQNIVAQPEHISSHNSEQEKTPNESRKERIVILDQELSQYEGPKNDRELEIATEETRQQFAHANETFDLTNETKQQLGDKMNGEIARARERMVKYQEILQEDRVIKAQELISAIGGEVNLGIEPYKQFNPNKQERFLIQKGQFQETDVVFKVGEKVDIKTIQNESRNLRIIEQAPVETGNKLDVNFVRQIGDVFEDDKMCGLATEHIQDDSELKPNLSAEQKTVVIGKTIDNLHRLVVTDEALKSGLSFHDGEKIVNDAQYFLETLSREGIIDAENGKLLQDEFRSAFSSLMAERPVFAHGDAHGDNIIVKRSGDDELSIFLLDFEGLRISNQYHDWSEILNKSVFLKHLQVNRPELFEPIKGNVENMWLDDSVVFDEQQIIDKVTEGDPDKARNFRLTRTYDMLTRIMNDRNSENPLAQERTRLYLEYIQKEVK
ncbi:MAG: hypothetical protein Q7S57_03485 [bacterium]|nr:hypothetical protein [bacterium]